MANLIERLKRDNPLNSLSHSKGSLHRLIPHAQFYTSQGLDASLDCLRHAVASRGQDLSIAPRDAAIRASWDESE